MAVYAVGDVQGCAAELEALLIALNFDARADRVWLVGDLVNRGPRSLDVLRLVRGLGDRAVVVLGNHDLHLLALARGGSRGGLRRSASGAAAAADATLLPVLQARDREPLLDWLQSRPLLHHDVELQLTMIHAGLPPQWDLATARHCARELEAALRGEHSGELFASMYGDQPELWDESLEGAARLRFIVNCFTRLRVCDLEGRLRLKHKGPVDRLPAGIVPWFRAPNRRSAGQRIVCGHWSALGYLEEAGVLALDTGCVWGGSLTGQRIDARCPPVSVANRSGGRRDDVD